MQILVNLISNAIKYTPHGYVKVIFTCGSQELNIQVKDSGTGITERDQKNLFQVFGLLDGGSSHTRSGIGLTLCKQVLDHWGGGIQLNSKERLGTEVNVEVPVKFDDPDESTFTFEEEGEEFWGLNISESITRKWVM